MSQNKLCSRASDSTIKAFLKKEKKEKQKEEAGWCQEVGFGFFGAHVHLILYDEPAGLHHHTGGLNILTRLLKTLAL